MFASLSLKRAHSLVFGGRERKRGEFATQDVQPAPRSAHLLGVRGAGRITVDGSRATNPRKKRRITIPTSAATTEDSATALNDAGDGGRRRGAVKLRGTRLPKKGTKAVSGFR